MNFFGILVRGLLFVILLVTRPASVVATHIVGGQLEMVTIGNKAGHFKIKMTYYYNEAQTANLPQSNSNVVIFRKSDGRKMAEYTLPNTTLTNRPPITFTNPACALANNLRISRVEFETEIQLTINDYNDPQGYYLIQQNCCRNANIANLVNPQSTPFLFYLEFPALLQSNQPFLNSSPVFLPLVGDYICIGTPFTFSTVATDADGDELRYSLVSPLAGTFSVNTNTSLIQPAPYPEVNWKAGFNPQAAIPGNPALTIDAQRGILSVKANQVGLFVFSVRVEEFRAGVKIGEVRRDLQLLVLDCPTTNLPKPVVLIQNQPVGSSTVKLCKGKTVLLQTMINPDWSYQWSKNNVNIDGATGSSLPVDQPGDYTVAISLLSTCSQRVNSEVIHITDASSIARLSAKGPSAICKNGRTTELNAPSEGSYTYQWFRDGSKLDTEVSSTLTIDQPGQYFAALYDVGQNCSVYTDTILITQRSAPIVKISTASATTAICAGDSLLLTGSGASSYVWNVDGLLVAGAVQPTFHVKAPGTVTLIGTDTAGCQATSTPFVVSLLTKSTITFDSIPTFCGIDHPPVQLKGSPAGGLFYGKGVVNDTFDPQLVGVGVYELTYTIQNATNQCYNRVAKQQVKVAPVPTIRLPAEVTTYKGGDITLQPTLTGQPVHFSWQPTTFLTASDQPTVRALNVEQETLYTLMVSNEAGCQTKDSVRVRVYQRVWIPDTFTPNGDTVNDTWELKGIAAYPQAQLTICNRWGEVVYQTIEVYRHPFDGTYLGELLPTGTYSYVLRIDTDQPIQKGTVLLLR